MEKRWVLMILRMNMSNMGVQSFKEALAYLFNRIVNEENIPRSFKLAVKIPIHKSNKDNMTFDNSRGISLLTTFNEIFESIIDAE